MKSLLSLLSVCLSAEDILIWRKEFCAQAVSAKWGILKKEGI